MPLPVRGLYKGHISDPYYQRATRLSIRSFDYASNEVSWASARTSRAMKSTRKFDMPYKKTSVGTLHQRRLHLGPSWSPEEMYVEGISIYLQFWKKIQVTELRVTMGEHRIPNSRSVVGAMAWTTDRKSKPWGLSMDPCSGIFTSPLCNTMQNQRPYSKPHRSKEDEDKGPNWGPILRT